MNRRNLARTIRLTVLLSLCFAASWTQAAQQSPRREIPRDELLSAARQIMEAARYCALVTVDESGRPQARTIDPFPPEKDMVVWFATNPKTRKVRQIGRDRRVTLYYFDVQSLAYVTLLGTARLVNDVEEKSRRWKAGWETFYRDREASYLLVAVTPERLEVVSTKLGIGGDPTTWRPPAVEFGPGTRER